MGCVRGKKSGSDSNLVKLFVVKIKATVTLRLGKSGLNYQTAKVTLANNKTRLLTAYQLARPRVRAAPATTLRRLASYNASGHANGFCGLARIASGQALNGNRPSAGGGVVATETLRRIWQRW